MKRLRFLALSALLTAAVGQAAIVDVNIFDFGFAPEVAAVAPGDTVRWINSGSLPHTSTSGKPDSAPGRLWSSPVLAAGDSFLLPVTFDGGLTPYYCSHHSLSMRGLLSVSVGVNDRPAPVGAARLVLPPLNPTSFELDLRAAASVSAGIYDATGQLRIPLLSETRLAAGTHGIRLDGPALGNGVYILSVTAGDWARAARLVIAR